MAGKNLLKTRAIDPTDAVFGDDLEGNHFHTNLSGGPHWIVAGQTGSGKSVYLNSLLSSCMFHATPDELIITAVDPKKVEFSNYDGLPFCPIDSVTNMSDAYGLLAYWTWEMDERYSALEAVNVKNLAEYNEWAEKDENKERAEELGYPRMKYVICVIDEYADMVMQESTVEDLIVRLAQKARAAGITLLIATQRPSADIISPTIKANVPARIGLKTTDSTNSMIVIDESGLEKLRGYGDSIVKLTDGSMVHVQGPYISNAELDKMFSDLKKKYPAPTPINYKQICVDNQLCDWAEKYDDDVPMKDRHLTKHKKSFRRL